MSNIEHDPPTWTLVKGPVINGKPNEFAIGGPRPLGEGEQIVVIPISHYLGAVEEVERLRRLIGEAYVQRGSRPAQALRELFGATRAEQPE